MFHAAKESPSEIFKAKWTPSPLSGHHLAHAHTPPISQAPVVQTVDNAIHRINHYPLDIAIGFAITYPVDSAIHRLNN